MKTRRTAFAFAAMATLLLVTGTIAAASVGNLPLLGFGAPTPAREASPVTAAAATTQTSAVSSTSSTSKPPVVMEQVIYEDVYERAPRRGHQQTDGASTNTAPSNAPEQIKPSTPTTGAAAPTAAAAPTPSTRPQPPAGCKEAEWEHGRWKCESDDDHHEDHDEEDD